MARKNKYETHVIPFLEVISAWCKQGASDEEIAKKLGIAYSTFRRYKSEHPELEEAMKFSKEHADLNVEASLYKKARGHITQVKKTFKCKETYYDQNGRKCEREILKEGIDEVYIPPDTQAEMFWLTNREPDKWKHKQTTTTSIDVKAKLEDFI